MWDIHILSSKLRIFFPYELLRTATQKENDNEEQCKDKYNNFVK